jgi:hypothetical protein
VVLCVMVAVVTQQMWAVSGSSDGEPTQKFVVHQSESSQFRIQPNPVYFW